MTKTISTINDTKKADKPTKGTKLRRILTKMVMAGSSLTVMAGMVLSLSVAITSPNHDQTSMTAAFQRASAVSLIHNFSAAISHGLSQGMDEGIGNMYELAASDGMLSRRVSRDNPANDRLLRNRGRQHQKHRYPTRHLIWAGSGYYNIRPVPHLRPWVGLAFV